MGLKNFFCDPCQDIIYQGIKKDKLCNMDETGFIQKQKSRNVVVLKRSINLWAKCADAIFYMTFFVCVSASKSAAPPLLIILGKRLNRDVLKGCNILGANITTAAKNIINSTLF